MRRPDIDVPARGRIGSHRLAGVENQIEEHLLKLNAVTHNRRHASVERDAHLDAALDKIAARDPQYIHNEFARGERLQVRLSRLEERAQSLDDFARPLVFAHDVGKNVARLGEIGRLLREQALCRLRIGENDGQRLVQLVRQGVGELSHGRHARNMRQFSLQSLQLRFSLFAFSDVNRNAAQPERLASGVTLHLSASHNPACRAVPGHHAIFGLECATDFERMAYGPLSLFTVVGMNRLEKAIEIEPLECANSCALTAFLGHPNLVPNDIPLPEAEVGGAGCQPHALLTFQQLT
jgi:hypothetical protein